MRGLPERLFRSDCHDCLLEYCLLPNEQYLLVFIAVRVYARVSILLNYLSMCQLINNVYRIISVK